MNAVRYNPANLPAVLRVQYERFGGLTLAELATLSNTQDTPKRVNVDHILMAFEIAHAKGGSKQPQMLVQGFKFKYATRGSTPGAIFVTESDMGFDEYLGKFWQGEFMPVRACTPEQKARILAIAADPLEAIIAYGRATGKCSICSRKLTDPESVEAGVGPICRAKFGL